MKLAPGWVSANAGAPPPRYPNTNCVPVRVAACSAFAASLSQNIARSVPGTPISSSAKAICNPTPPTTVRQGIRRRSSLARGTPAAVWIRAPLRRGAPAQPADF